MIKRRVWIPLAAVILAVAMIAAGLLFYSVLKLNVLVTDYLLLIGAVLVLFLYTIGVLLFYGVYKRGSTLRRVRRVIGVILAIVLAAVCFAGTYVLYGINKTKDRIATKPISEIKAIMGVYVMKDDPAQSLEDLGGYQVGVLGDLGDEKINSNYAIEQIDSVLGTPVTALSYPGITDAAGAIRDGNVQALAVNKNFLSLLNDTESFNGFADEMRLIDEIRVPISATQDNTPDLIQPGETAKA